MTLDFEERKIYENNILPTHQNEQIWLVEVFP